MDRKIILLPVYGTFLVVAAILELLFPFLRTRIWIYRTSRLGHQVADIDLFLRRRAIGANPKDAWCEIFLTDKPANETFLEITREKLCVVSSPMLFAIANFFNKRFPQWRSLCHLPGHLQPHLIFQSSPASFMLPDALRKQGAELLERMGIPQDATIVCFHCRDDSYLKNKFPERDWTYHDYRNSNIKNYLLAARLLADQGIWALRLGEVVTEKIDTSHPHIVDYANKFRSDFGDIFLIARCKFLLGTNCGIGNVPPTFDTPEIWSNMAPLGQAPWRAHDMFIPKLYRNTDTGKILTFKEIIQNGGDHWSNQNLFDKHHVTVIENTPQEIADVTLELNSRLDGSWQDQPGDQERQDHYRRLWPPNHPIYGYAARIGAQFLRTHEHLL